MAVLAESAYRPLATDLTSLETGARLNLHPSGLPRLVSLGKLRGAKRAGIWFFNAEDVRRLAQERGRPEVSIDAKS